MPKANPGNRTDRRGHRPSHDTTESNRKQVEALASFGVPQADIARMLGICEKTLRKHYSDTLANAVMKANSMVAQSLFNRAIKGDGPSSTTAAIFWLKTRAKWSEREIHEISGPNGGPIPMMDYSLLSKEQLLTFERLLEILNGRRPHAEDDNADY